MGTRRIRAGLTLFLMMWVGIFFWSNSGYGEETPQAKIDGFRSAQFGMSEPQVIQAIFQDFKIAKSQIHRKEHPNEKTVSLQIDAKELLSGSGPTKIFYVLGFKSKQLIQVNILWGRPATDQPDPSAVVAAANQLRDYFLRQGFQKEGLVANAPLAEGLIMVFRGKDAKGRMVELVLTTPVDEKFKSNANISLRLSYIKNPENPDIFRINPGDF